MAIKDWIKREATIVHVKYGVGGLLLLSYALAVFALLRTNMLPIQNLGVAILATLAVVVVLLYLHFYAKLSRAKTIALIVVSLGAIVVCGWVYVVGSATTRLINSLQEDGYTYIEYAVVADKDRPIRLETSHQAMGIVTSDVNNDAVKKAVSAKTTPHYLDYDDPTSAVMAVEDNSAAMAVLSSSYLQLLSDNDQAMYNHLQKLYTFTIKVKRSSSRAVVDVTRPFVLYISGIDTYGNIADVSRSDVNMLAVVNPRTHKVLLVNTPRDYYVQLHGTHGIKDKLTHAGIYGIDTSVATMQDLYGISIDYTLRINFSSLVAIIDTLGGVDVQSDYDFTVGRDHFVAGTNHLNGAQALEFSRERHAFEGGDRTRGANQQRVIEAIIAKLSSPATLLNYRSVVAALGGTMQTNMSTANMTAFVRSQLSDPTRWGVKSLSVDGTDSQAYTYSMGNIPLYVMEPNQASVNAAKQQITQYLQ